MEKYSDTKESKVFNDPIHGHIKLHPVLVKIINTPEFQRLRNIKQLGGVYFVYPGASHNRFEHSIGVAHLAGELAKALKVKQLEQIKPLEELKKLKDLESLSNEELNLLKKLDMCTWEELEKMKKLKSLKTDELEEWKKLKPEDVEKFEKLKVFNPEDLKTLNNSLISDRDVLCVQIAGLCHDIGHGPFSHLFDRMFMPEADKEDNGKWKHEDASIKMFDRLLGKENGLKKMMKECRLEIEENERDRWFIEELITGHPKELPDQDKRSQKEELDQDMWKYKGRDEEKSFLYEIVSNKGTGIDVDKFDYFARDCHHLGIRNNFDHKRFIMFARVCDVKEDRRKHICSRDKEVANLYDLFEQRHSIHRRACKHKIVLAVEIMIKDALVLVNDHPDFKIRFLKDSEEVMLSLSKAKEDMGAYIKLTDQVIERILYSESSSNEDNSQKEAREKARKIVQRVMDRDLYRCVGQAKNKDQMEISKEMEDNLKELVRKIPHDGEEKFVIIVLPLDYGKEDRDPMSKPFIYRSQKTDKGSPTSTSDKKYQVEISKKMEESFKKMVEDNPVGGEDKFVIIAVPLDYGKEDSGPMSKPYIYRTQNPDKQIPISESERKEKDEKKRKNLEKMKEELRKKLHISFSEVDNGKNDGEDHGEEDHGNDNFEVNIVTLDYGMENVDPISKAYFYCKDNPDGGIPISKSKVSKFLPEHFSEDKFMVYWKNHEELKGKDRDKKEKEVMGFFKTWCKENGFEDVEEDDGSGTTAAASNSRK